MTTVPDGGGQDRHLRRADAQGCQPERAVQRQQQRGKVVAQSVTAGGTAAYGTVITLTTDSGEDTAAAEPVQDDGTIDPANEAG